jgi:hypothetical protein
VLHGDVALITRKLIELLILGQGVAPVQDAANQVMAAEEDQFKPGVETATAETAKADVRTTALKFAIQHTGNKIESPLSGEGLALARKNAAK